jgi:hypothetical protein
LEIQPWHIALFVIAVLIVAWQVFGTVRRQTAASTPKFVTQQPVAGAPPPPAQLAKPGTGTQRMFEEKDRM